MNIINYEIHNVLRARDISLDMQGRNLFLVGGKTAQGKSSTLKALLMAICGRSGMDDYPEVALAQGQDKGWVKVKLSGDSELHENESLTVELFLRRKRNGTVMEEFRILDSAGEEAPEPRTLLKRLYDLKGFDPLAFDHMDRKERRATLMRLAGLDFDAANKERKTLYDERTASARDGKKLAAECDLLPHYPEAPDQELDVAELMRQISEAEQFNKANAKARRDVETRRSLVERSRSEVAKIEEQIKLLQERLEKEREVLAEHEQELASQQAAAGRLVDQDTDLLKTQVSDAADVNRKVQANRVRSARVADLEAAREEWRRLDDAIKAIDDVQREAIASAKYPVEGMSFDDDGVLLNGLPWEQASHRERIMASVDVGIALNPKLRLFVCEDGGALDVETIEALDEKLKQTGYQMLAEMVTRSEFDEGLCAVVIHDGKVQSHETPEPDSSLSGS